MQNKKQMPIIREKKSRNRSSRKLLILLFLFFITLLLILFFNSSISRVSVVEISGNRHLTQKQIRQASQIKVGDHFFALGSNTIKKRVMKLKIAQSVEVTKSFPGRISIKVEEFPEVAFVITPEAVNLALLANGSTIPIGAGAIIDKPVLTGWKKEDPKKLELCKVLAAIPPKLLADISEIKPDPTVSYPDKIKLYTRSSFEVSTSISLFPHKIEYMSYIIEGNQPGYITMLEADHYSPFEKDKPSSVDEAAGE